MFVPWRIAVAVAAALLVAGCATSTPVSKQATPLPGEGEVPQAAVPAPEAPPLRDPLPRPEALPVVPTPTVAAPAPAPAPVPVPAIEPVPVVAEAAARTNTAPTAAAPAVVGWADWENWVEERGLGRLQQTGPAGEPVYELYTVQGVFALSPGNRNARWNGLLIGLGYAPRVVGSRLQVHGLDLEKNLLPLLEPDPAPPGQGRLIVLDPGHGGANLGAKSAYNARVEKELTLDWAYRLKSLLETQGWQVLLTRTNDVEVDLAARTAFADRVGADLFVSLHFNTAAPNPAPSGLETYCTTPVGLPSNLTRGYPDPLGRPLPNNAFDAQNLQLAARIHRALLSVTAGVDRGVRRARFMDVLVLQRRPAVLVEGGYLSNPREARLIAGAEYLHRMAEAIARAIGPAASRTDLAAPPPAAKPDPRAGGR